MKIKKILYTVILLCFVIFNKTYASTIRLGYSYSLINSFQAEVIKIVFEKIFPNDKLELIEKNNTSLLREISQNKIDVLIKEISTLDKQLKKDLLVKYRMNYVVKSLSNISFFMLVPYYLKENSNLVDYILNKNDFAKTKHYFTFLNLPEDSFTFKYNKDIIEKYNLYFKAKIVTPKTLQEYYLILNKLYKEKKSFVTTGYNINIDSYFRHKNILTLKKTKYLFNNEIYANKKRVTKEQLDFLSKVIFNFDILLKYIDELDTKAIHFYAITFLLSEPQEWRKWLNKEQSIKLLNFLDNTRKEYTQRSGKYFLNKDYCNLIFKSNNKYIDHNYSVSNCN